MAKITFLGAAGTVTGSKYLIETGRKRLLVDCGLFQGSKDLQQRNWNPLTVDPATIDWVLLTHAHIDHTGYLPRLVAPDFAAQFMRTPRRASFATCFCRIRRTCRKKMRNSQHAKVTAATSRRCRFTPCAGAGSPDAFPGNSARGRFHDQPRIFGAHARRWAHSGFHVARTDDHRERQENPDRFLRRYRPLRSTDFERPGAALARRFPAVRIHVRRSRTRHRLGAGRTGGRDQPRGQAWRHAS